MPSPLKAYEPSEKGRELIALLFPMSHRDREKNILEYAQQYPQELDAVLDGFHFSLQEIIEARDLGNRKDKLQLNRNVFFAIIKRMKEENNNFSYNSSRDFFQALDGYEPPVFHNPQQVHAILTKVLSAKPETGADQSQKMSSETRKKLDTVCKRAAEAYACVDRILPSLRNSQKVIDAYNDVSNKIELMDVKLAKETFLESKKIFLENAKIVAQGMPLIYQMFKSFPEQLEIMVAYTEYLAKLLASREARNPVENYVLLLAKGDFNYKLPDFEPTKKQLDKEITRVHLRRNFKDKQQVLLNRLECRYRKRKLMVQLKQGEQKSKIISELMGIADSDPIDLKTHILLARLFSEYASGVKNPHKRRGLRDQALAYCKSAYAIIDDYLNLQGIKKMKVRNMHRAGFMKTISAIRIPLIKR